MVIFLKGLNNEKSNVTELQNHVELEDMMHMTTKMEMQRKRQGSSNYS
jgi:hypothetical protein